MSTSGVGKYLASEHGSSWPASPGRTCGSLSISAVVWQHGVLGGRPSGSLEGANTQRSAAPSRVPTKSVASPAMLAVAGGSTSVVPVPRRLRHSAVVKEACGWCCDWHTEKIPGSRCIYLSSLPKIDVCPTQLELLLVLLASLHVLAPGLALL